MVRYFMPVDVVLDRRLSITSVRLYGMLRQGHSIPEVASILNANVDHIRRAERALIRFGYIERVVTRRAGVSDVCYNFPDA